MLAAPLMAGNDLRTMSEEVRDVLTAPELIAVNQDKRGVQGYMVFDDGSREVYNKVLWDSGEMTKGSPAKEIDIELKDVQCLMLVFDGDQVLGNWADARVINESLSE